MSEETMTEPTPMSATTGLGLNRMLDAIEVRIENDIERALFGQLRRRITALKVLGEEWRDDETAVIHVTNGSWTELTTQARLVRTDCGRTLLRVLGVEVKE